MSENKKLSIKKLVILIFILIIFILPIFTSIFFFYRYRKLTSMIDFVNSTDNVKIMNQLSDLLDTSNFGQPNIATITDKDKLSNQPFFDKAENDDKLIIFPKEKKAILYRPSINKIVNFAEITEKQAQTTTPEEQKEEGEK